MNTPAKTADRSARSSASASSLLTNVERDWMLSLDESELTAFLRSIPPASRPAILCELRDHKTALERAETSLHEFVKQAWPHVESRVDFVDNWHIAALCRHLEAVTHGEISQLLINVPPGCMKSLLCAVFWPAWVWGPCRQPDMRWLFISYAQPLSTRDAVRARRLIESTWYQERWGHIFTFVDDQNQKVRYETNRGGWRVSTSNGGIGTGEHPDILVADDFFNAEQCDSDVARQNGLDWWDGTTTTRGISRNVRRVAIGQRFHEEDLSGHLVAEGGWDHICLPMEFEPGRMPPTSIGWTDPRTERGELLWPVIFSEDRVRDLTRKLRPHRAAGQLQQNPTAREGELFKRPWFQTIDLYELPMSIFRDGRAVRYWDKAGTEGGGAYTAGVLMARLGPIWYVIHVVRGQWAAHARETKIIETTMSDATLWECYSVWQEQEPGSGGKESAEITTRALAGYAVHTERVTGSKQSRWEPWEAQLEAGNIRLIKAEWNRAFIDEHCSAPRGKYKDQIDAASGAFAKLVKRREFFVCTGD
jgi:predicted phage terminase large subunit-like protein